MTSTYRIIGITDTVGTCDCCGRTDLKRTVILDRDGATVYFGTQCAARHLSIAAIDVKRQAMSVDRQRANEASKARYAAQSAEDQTWERFLAEKGTGDGIAIRIQSLGGFNAARQAFREWDGK